MALCDDAPLVVHWAYLAREERRAQRVAEGRVNHGRGGYQLGCRCDECRETHNGYMRTLRALHHLVDYPDIDNDGGHVVRIYKGRSVFFQWVPK